MLGSDDHKGHAKEGVGTGGVNAELFVDLLEGEVDKCACGFADPVREYAVKVDFCKELLSKIPQNKQNALLKILEHDPRPSYQDDPEREYGMLFSDYEIFFKVSCGTLTVTRIGDRK